MEKPQRRLLAVEVCTGLTLIPGVLQPCRELLDAATFGRRDLRGKWVAAAQVSHVIGGDRLDAGW